MFQAFVKTLTSSVTDEEDDRLLFFGSKTSSLGAGDAVPESRALLRSGLTILYFIQCKYVNWTFTTKVISENLHVCVESTTAVSNLSTTIFGWLTSITSLEDIFLVN